MKKLQILAAAIFALVSLASCSDDDEKTGDGYKFNFIGLGTLENFKAWVVRYDADWNILETKTIENDGAVEFAGLTGRNNFARAVYYESNDYKLCAIESFEGVEPMDFYYKRNTSEKISSLSLDFSNMPQTMTRSHVAIKNRYWVKKREYLPIEADIYYDNLNGDGNVDFYAAFYNEESSAGYYTYLKGVDLKKYPSGDILFNCDKELSPSEVSSNLPIKYISIASTDGEENSMQIYDSDYYSEEKTSLPILLPNEFAYDKFYVYLRSAGEIDKELRVISNKIEDRYELPDFSIDAQYKADEIKFENISTNGDFDAAEAVWDYFDVPNKKLLIINCLANTNAQSFSPPEIPSEIWQRIGVSDVAAALSDDNTYRAVYFYESEQASGFDDYIERSFGLQSTKYYGSFTKKYTYSKRFY